MSSIGQENRLKNSVEDLNNKLSYLQDLERKKIKISNVILLLPIGVLTSRFPSPQWASPWSHLCLPEYPPKQITNQFLAKNMFLALLSAELEHFIS